MKFGRGEYGSNNIASMDWTPWSDPLVVSCGGGINSFAMLVGLYEKKLTPSVILFADTSGEKPETYAALSVWSKWAESVGFPPICTVMAKSVDASLYDACLKTRALPSVAYGFKTCSMRWKVEPQEKYMRAWMKSKGISRYVKAIGIDAGEPHRAKHYEDKNSITWFPLLDWNWRREECEAAIYRAGMAVPPKSACYFCPSSKKSEVLWLKNTHPLLYKKSIEMERNAKLDTVKGLGRHWSWEELGRADEAQFKMFPETVEMPCMCFDGEES
jgi:3'-phosphoadenosine 5'-phosphosulfate sulfotransferase (PAPS reductase)/FAD synthetase